MSRLQGTHRKALQGLQQPGGGSALDQAAKVGSQLNMSELTETQSAVLNFLKSFRAGAGWMPSTREIQEHFGYRSQTAAVHHLEAIEKKGFIRRAPGQPRCIVIL